MIFTAPQFWVFFAVVLALVAINARTLRSLTAQQSIFLASSYFFYAQWDWRFLSLIIVSTVVGYGTGLKIASGTNKRAWLCLSLGVNLGILGTFKYLGFFVEEAFRALHAAGIEVSSPALNLILPVGISFYTFQTLTYGIDIYRGTLQPTRDLLPFATYVSFFPQLVAGPIERASRLLPQLNHIWRYDEQRIIEGLRLILIGMLLKVVVADGLGPRVDSIFSDPSSFGGGELALGALYFAFQIYGDFCGYSTIAIGVARILDIELMTNFRTPYFATSIQSFWRQWHISLSTFFRDYVFIPLGGSRAGWSQTSRNLVLTFMISGLWHGANWTFLVWSLYHGVLLVLENLVRSEKSGRETRPLVLLAKGATTFLLVCISWVIFRSPSVTFAVDYLTRMIGDFGWPTTLRGGLVLVALGVAIDWMWRRDTTLASIDPLGKLGAYPAVATAIRWSVYCSAGWLILLTMARRSGVQQFIYFQF